MESFTPVQVEHETCQMEKSYLVGVAFGIGVACKMDFFSEECSLLGLESKYIMIFDCHLKKNLNF